MVWGYPCEWGPVQKHKTDAGAKDAVMSRLFSFFASAVEGVVPESEAQKRSWQDVWNPPPLPLLHLLTHSSRVFAIYDGRVSRTCPIMCSNMWSSHQLSRSLAFPPPSSAGLDAGLARRCDVTEHQLSVARGARSLGNVVANAVSSETERGRRGDLVG